MECTKETYPLAAMVARHFHVTKERFLFILHFE